MRGAGPRRRWALALALLAVLAQLLGARSDVYIMVSSAGQPWLLQGRGVRRREEHRSKGLLKWPLTAWMVARIFVAADVHLCL